MPSPPSSAITGPLAPAKPQPNSIGPPLGATTCAAVMNGNPITARKPNGIASRRPIAMPSPNYEQVLNATEKHNKIKLTVDWIAGFYPAPQASDPRVFYAAMAMLLAEYHDDVINAFAH